MDQEHILILMKEYFEARKPSEVGADFAQQPVAALLKDSLEVVDFFIHLEDQLQVDTGADLNRLGPRLMNSNFQELAAEVEKGFKPQAE
jgi:hypothetical protein